MKKITAAALAMIMVWGLVGCGNSNSSTSSSDEELVHNRILDVSEYYDEKLISELSRLSRDEDADGVISLLLDAINRFEEDVTFFTNKSSSDTLSEEHKQACLDAKTALYGVSSSALGPAYDFYSNGVGGVPDRFAEYVSTGREYLDKACSAVS